MTQEVQVTLTLEVDVTLQKSDIELLMRQMIHLFEMNSQEYNEMKFDFHTKIFIKEESEIYQNE